MDNTPADPRSIAVHRCRFVDWNPAAITAIAFPPRALPALNGKGKQPEREGEREIKPGHMAVGRANGNIELYAWAGEGAAQAWVHSVTLHGPAGSKVDTLAFALRHPHTLSPWDTAPLSALRLFSTTGGSELLEWSLATLAIAATVPSGGGSIWSVAVNPAGTRLAMGCADGAVRLVDLLGGVGEARVERRLERVRPRLLSLAWGPPVLQTRAGNGQATTTGGGVTPRSDSDDSDSDSDADAEPQWADTYLLAGCSDSSLRKYALPSGTVVQRLTLAKARAEPTLAWAVGVLPDGTLVSGDSLGNVGFWDGAAGTLLQSFPSHGADVLALAVGPNGQTVYTTGIDQKVAEHTLVALPGAAPRWVQTAARRLHAHDVRALAVWPPAVTLPGAAAAVRSRTCAVLASGGVDLSPVLTPCAPGAGGAGGGGRGVANILQTSRSAAWADSWQRRVPYVGRDAPLLLAPRRRWVVCRREQGVGIWYLRNGAGAGDGGVKGRQGDAWGKALDMELAGTGNLVCMALGEPEEEEEPAWLAVSDATEVKLWRLVGTGEHIRPKRIKDFSATILPQLSASPSLGSPFLGAAALAFTPSASHLLLATTPSSTPSSSVLVLALPDMRITAALVPPTSTGTRTEPRPWITALAVSPDGRYCATLDTGGQCTVYALGPAPAFHASLPAFPSHPTALAFVPRHTASPSPSHSHSPSPAKPEPEADPLLLLALADNTLHAYSLKYRRLADECKAACARVSAHLATRHDPIVGLACRAGGGGKEGGGAEVFVWAASWICRVDLLAGSGEAAPAGLAGAGGGGLRKRKRAASAAGVGAAYDLRAPGGGGEKEGEASPLRVETRYKYVALVGFVSPGVGKTSGRDVDMDLDADADAGDEEDRHGQGREMMVVVERPVADVLAEGPGAWYRKKFGT